MLYLLTAMAGKRKQPKLRLDGVYYNVKVYTLEGKRTQVSFGHIDDHRESEVRATFAIWLELYTHDPQTVFSFRSPYDAGMANFVAWLRQQ